MTTLAVSDKCIPERLFNARNLQDWVLVYWEAACLVWSPQSCITAARCSCARVVHCKVKVTSSLTDLWQQLFEQQDITVIVLCTIHFHHWLHENHTSAPAPGDTDWNRNAGTCLSETSKVCPWAEMASDWNMVSNQQSFIGQSIDQWRNCFTACLKAKSKHFEHLLWCVSLWYVTVMTFKAQHYCCYEQIDLRFFSQGSVRTAVRRGSQFCCSCVVNLLKYPCAKNYENIMRFDKVIAKIIRVHFFCLTALCRKKMKFA